MRTLGLSIARHGKQGHDYFAQLADGFRNLQGGELVTRSECAPLRDDSLVLREVVTQARWVVRGTGVFRRVNVAAIAEATSERSVSTATSRTHRSK